MPLRKIFKPTVCSFSIIHIRKWSSSKFCIVLKYIFQIFSSYLYVRFSVFEPVNVILIANFLFNFMAALVNTSRSRCNFVFWELINGWL